MPLPVKKRAFMYVPFPGFRPRDRCLSTTTRENILSLGVQLTRST